MKPTVARPLAAFLAVLAVLAGLAALAAAARGGCAVGPGAALALASRSGAVASYEPRLTSSVGPALAGWPVWPHPALLLYGIGVAWTGVIAAVALAGPWRREPLVSAGFIRAATIAVIGLDVITGSHLQPETPFGQSALVANRFYGIGNNAIGVYALGGLLCAAWAGDVALRRARSRGRAVAAAGAVTLFTVIAAAWPHFGAKVGGTIAMVPAFLVLLAAIAGVRITPRRSALVAVSGVLLIAAFAVLNFWFPAATGTSDLGVASGAAGVAGRRFRGYRHRGCPAAGAAAGHRHRVWLRGTECGRHVGPWP